LKSIDGGNTWTTTCLTWTVNEGRHISRLLINPTNPDILIAFSTIGIFRTISVGEKMEDLQLFDRKEFVDSLFSD
jgi:hypothetical protein